MVKACKSQSHKRVREVNFPGRQEEEFFLGEITKLDAVQGSTGDAWKAKVSLNELLVEFKLDTGTDVTVFSQHFHIASDDAH